MPSVRQSGGRGRPDPERGPRQADGRYAGRWAANAVNIELPFFRRVAQKETQTQRKVLASFPRLISLSLHIVCIAGTAPGT